MDVSPLRLRLLRATYLLLVVGLGVTIWPELLRPRAETANTRGVISSLLGALGVLALPGLVYPLRMLPIILFELIWKTVWVAAFGLPLWLRGALDPSTAATLRACLMGVVILPPVIPWGYVARHYFGAGADRRRGGGPSGVGPS